MSTWWIDILRPGLLALLFGLLFFIPAWVVYRWGVIRGKFTLFRPAIRLLVILITGLVIMGSGGREAVLGLEAALHIVGPDQAGIEAGLILILINSGLIILAALTLARLLDTVIFETRIGIRGDRQVPKLLRDTLTLVIITIAVGIILVEQLDVNATLVGGGAAAITVLLGLAMQNILGDLLSGVVLQFERPFRVGEWIIVGEHEGEVVEINWRATRLNSRKNEGIVIPNSVIAKAEIKNLHLNTPNAAVDRFVGTEYKEPPNRVKGAIMEAILQCPEVLHQPSPRVWTHEYGSSAVIYCLRFWVKDFARIPKIADEVLTNIWYVFKRYDITIPWPIRNVYLRQEEKPTAEEQADSIIGLLRQVDIFAPLTRGQIEVLADGLEPKFFGRGEVLVQQGEEGNSFFIIGQGRVEVSVIPEGSSTEVSVAVLGPRDFFGEMSLLAGDRRNATVRAIEDVWVVIIDKDAFAGIIQEHPEVAAEVAAMYYRRAEELHAMHERAAAGTAEGADGEEGERALLRRIQRFFGL